MHIKLAFVNPLAFILPHKYQFSKSHRLWSKSVWLPLLFAMTLSYITAEYTWGRLNILGQFGVGRVECWRVEHKRWWRLYIITFHWSWFHFCTLLIYVSSQVELISIYWWSIIIISFGLVSHRIFFIFFIHHIYL